MSLQRTKKNIICIRRERRECQYRSRKCIFGCLHFASETVRNPNNYFQILSVVLHNARCICGICTICSCPWSDSQMHLLGAALVDPELMNEKGHINNRAHTVHSPCRVWSVTQKIHIYYATNKNYNIFVGEDSSVRTLEFLLFQMQRGGERVPLNSRLISPPHIFSRPVFTASTEQSCLTILTAPANKNTTRRGNRAGRFRMTHFRVLEGEGARNFPAPVLSSLLTK